MRKWLAAGISSFLVTSGLFVTTAIPAKAGGNMGDTDYNVTPFELVSLARQGVLNDEGIPSYAGLYSAYNQEELHARDLVQAAVESNRLSNSATNDENYLAAVERQLKALERPSDKD